MEMRRLLLGLAMVLCFGAHGADTPAEKKTVKKPGPLKVKYNGLLGLGLAKGSSLVVGGQLGFPISEAFPAFAGPEIDFALYSPGSIYTILGTFWYEIALDKTTKSNLSLGVAAGIASTDRLASFPSITYAVLGDIAVSQEVDEDVFVRGQLRPGVIGNYFAIWMNMNVTFLFR